MVLRAWSTKPAAPVAAVVTTATAIGAVVAITSLYRATVLNPMNVPAPNELVAIIAVHPTIANVPTSLSWVRFDNSLRHARAFSHVAAWDFDTVGLTAPGQPAEELTALRVSSDFFDVLGVRPHLGRVFDAADDQPNGPAVCVLSHALWTARFGQRPLVGQTIDLNGRATEIIGVLPPRFTAPWTDQQIFLPRVFDTSTMTPENVRNGSSYLAVIARLGSGVSLEQAQADLDGLATDYAFRFAGRTDAANRTSAVRFTERLVDGNRQTMTVLLRAVVAVLIVACVNASTLFLGRLLERRREFAIRTALGGSRPRLVGQLLGESLAWSAAAGAGGLIVAWFLLGVATWGLGALLPAGVAIGLDWMALGLTVLIIVTTALVIGLWPAVYVTRPVVASGLGFARSESTAAPGLRVRGTLVLAEVAVSSILLTGAGLLVASFMTLRQATPGFDSSGTGSGFVTLAPERYPTPDTQAAFAVEVVDRLQTLPGVRHAAAVFGLPLGPAFSFHQYVVAGRPVPPPSERQRAGIRLVTEDYFEVMRIALKAGRTFTAQDRAGAPLVCIVNASMARHAFEGDPIGQAVLRGRDASLRYEVVGVVEDVRTYGLRNDAVDEVYYPLRQLPWPQFAFVVRSDGDPAFLRRALEQTVAAVDASQPVSGFATMDDRLDRSRGLERSLAAVTSAFAALTLLMSLVGLYAVLSQSVASRTAEIGLRVAIGANRRDIVRLILGHGMAIVGLGIAIGLVLAAAGGAALASHLYGVDPRDPRVFGAVGLVFGAVGLVACLGPALRAARIDPVRALGAS